MKIGVRAHDFGRTDIGRLAGSIKAAGFSTVQLALTKAMEGIYDFYQVRREELDEVRNAFDSHSLEIGVMGCYTEIGSNDQDMRLRETDRFIMGLEHASLLGVRVAATETTRFAPHRENEPFRERAYQNLKDSVKRMIEAAERLGVDIAVETVADHTLNTAALTRRLLDEVGSRRLKVVFDPVNLILSPEDAAYQDLLFGSFIDLLGEDIAALHVKDIVFEAGEKKWRHIGQGIIKYEPIFKRLNAINPEIPALREMARPESAEIDVIEMRRLNNACDL